MGRKKIKKKAAGDEEQICRRKIGKWKCKSVRSDNKYQFCEKHYKDYKALQDFCRNRSKLRTKNRQGAVAGCSAAGVETRGSKSRNQSLVEAGGIQPPTSIGHIEEIRGSERRKKVAEEEIRLSKRMKTATEEDETGEIQPSTSDNTCSAKTVTKRKIGEPVAELESLEHYKSKCFEMTVELEKQRMELEKKNVEYTTLQGKYAELETKKTAAEDEDAVKYWRNKCSDLESLILRMEAENPTMRCEASRVSNLESLVTRNRKESSILRCEELGNGGKIESEVQGSEHEITESGETQRYKDNMSTRNAATSSGGREDSPVDELKAEVNKHHKSESEFHKFSALNISSRNLHLASGGEIVEEGKGLGCSEGRPFEHGSSSQAHLEMSKKKFVNLVSDTDDESVDSHGNPMDILATENCNRNKPEMKWKSEVKMLSVLEEDPELCLKAICALYRQEISEDEISPKGLVIDSDTLRCANLAKFLLDNDRKGDLKKSVKELEKFDSKAVGDCKKLVRRYSMYLFDIYENRKDPFFLPAITASHRDQTAKL